MDEALMYTVLCRKRNKIASQSFEMYQFRQQIANSLFLNVWTTKD